MTPPVNELPPGMGLKDKRSEISLKFMRQIQIIIKRVIKPDVILASEPNRQGSLLEICRGRLLPGFPEICVIRYQYHHLNVGVLRSTEYRNTAGWLNSLHSFECSVSQVKRELTVSNVMFQGPLK